MVGQSEQTERISDLLRQHRPDKIAAFNYDTLEAMPRAVLCSFCYGEKFRMMQRSPHSAYCEVDAETLTYINQRKFITPALPNSLIVSRL